MSDPTDKKPEGLTSEQEAALKARYTSKKGVIDYDKLREVAEEIFASVQGKPSVTDEPDTRTIRDTTTYEERAAARVRELERNRITRPGHLAVAQAGEFAEREKDKAEKPKGTGGVGGLG